MRIQVEVPAHRIDAATKKLKKDLEKALSRIQTLERERDQWKEKCIKGQQMRNDFMAVVDKYANYDQHDWGV